MIINEKYKIESDLMNVVLMERYEKKRDKDENGEFIGDIEYDFKVSGYFGTIKAALKGMCKREIQGDGLKDYESIVEKVDELYETINKLNI